MKPLHSMAPSPTTCCGAATVPLGGSDHADCYGGQREYLLGAAGELTRTLLAGQQPHDVLHLIAAKARQGSMASLAIVGSSTDGDLLLVDAAVGRDGERLRGQYISLTDLPVEEPTRGSTGTLGPADLADSSSLALPLGSAPGGAARVLVVLGLGSAHRAAATQALRAFAENAAQALELAHERLAAERERLFQERDRTAGHLQQLVIPQLFATSLQLASADGLIQGHPEQARLRLRQAVDDLDKAIVQVRTAALGLRTAVKQAADTAGLGLVAGGRRLGVPVTRG